MLPTFFNTPVTQQFCCPTQVVFGAGARDKVWEAVSESAVTVLVVDDYFRGDSFVREFVRRAMPVTRIVVTREPAERFVRECLTALPASVDTVVAVGGGSAMDTAKALTAFLRWGRLYVKDVDAPRCVPALVAVPTTVGTGSEVSRYYVLMDEATGRKRASRAWSICPDLALVDPAFLAKVPPSLLVSWSFDAFCHLWETYVSRTERSPFVDMLAREGLTRLLVTIAGLVEDKRQWTVETSSVFQFSGVLGGVAISNARTGLIHDAAEALAAQVDIAHPYALMVFFREALWQYHDAVVDHVAQIAPRLDRRGSVKTVHEIIACWESVWKVFGIDQAVRDRLRGESIKTDLIVEAVCADHVLFKDAPASLDRSAIERVVTRALEAWCE